MKQLQHKGLIVIKNKNEKKYTNKMKDEGLEKVCVWIAPEDKNKIKNTARLSRNRKMREK